MKIKLTISTNWGSSDSPKHELTIDGKHNRSIGPLCDCPEDAIIGRDLIDGYHLIRYIQMGYDAAQRGEALDIMITKKK